MENRDITELLKENIRLFDKVIVATDGINKRLVTAFIVAVLAFAFTVFSITYLYFKTDYDYPSVDQTQTVTQTVNEGVNK